MLLKVEATISLEKFPKNLSRLLVLDSIIFSPTSQYKTLKKIYLKYWSVPLCWTS